MSKTAITLSNFKLCIITNAKSGDFIADNLLELQLENHEHKKFTIHTNPELSGSDKGIVVCSVEGIFDGDGRKVGYNPFTSLPITALKSTWITCPNLLAIRSMHLRYNDTIMDVVIDKGHICQPRNVRKTHNSLIVNIKANMPHAIQYIETLSLLINGRHYTICKEISDYAKEAPFDNRHALNNQSLIFSPQFDISDGDEIILHDIYLKDDSPNTLSIGLCSASYNNHPVRINMDSTSDSRLTTLRESPEFVVEMDMSRGDAWKYIDNFMLEYNERYYLCYVNTEIDTCSQVCFALEKPFYILRMKDVIPIDKSADDIALIDIEWVDNAPDDVSVHVISARIGDVKLRISKTL